MPDARTHAALPAAAHHPCAPASTFCDPGSCDPAPSGPVSSAGEVPVPRLAAPKPAERQAFAPLPWPRREAFCHHYLLTGNATKSAIAAGYSRRSARATGSRMLTNDDILERIHEMRIDLGAASRIDRETQIVKLEHLFREGLTHRQFGVALRAVELQARLVGLFPQDKLALTLASAAAAPKAERPHYRPGEANGSDTEYWMPDSPAAPQHESASALPALRQPS